MTQQIPKTAFDKNDPPVEPTALAIMQAADYYTREEIKGLRAEIKRYINVLELADKFLAIDYECSENCEFEHCQRCQIRDILGTDVVGEYQL